MVWRRDNCAFACANPIRDALGYDPAEWFRGVHEDGLEWWNYGDQHHRRWMGLGFALRAVAQRHGWRRIPPRDAQPGDVGLIIQSGHPCVVICKAPGWFVGRSETGASLLPVKNIACPGMSVRLAWSVLP